MKHMIIGSLILISTVGCKQRYAETTIAEIIPPIIAPHPTPEPTPEPFPEIPCSDTAASMPSSTDFQEPTVVDAGLSWHTIGQMPVFGSSFAPAFYNGDIWFCGGIYRGFSVANENSACYRNGVKIFDMGVCRGYGRSWQVGQYIYILGGRERFRAVKTFVKIDLINQTTTFLGEMNFERAAFALGVFDDGRVIVVGGVKPNETGYENVTTILKSAEMYHPETNSWEVIEDYPFAAEAFNGAVLNGKFTVFGGLSFTTLKTIPRQYHHEIYEYNNGWQLVGDTGFDVSSFATAVVEDKAYVIGGHNITESFSNRVFSWDGTSFEETPHKLMVATGDIDAVVFESKILIMGGEATADMTADKKTKAIQVGIFN